MVVLCPHAMVDARKADISISSFFENKCGIETGSLEMNSVLLY
jgi:hypothetical protein